MKFAICDSITTLFFLISFPFSLLGLSGCAGRPDITPSIYTKDTQQLDKKNNKIVVFVHGVIGEVEETWTYKNGDKSVSWPDLVKADPHLRHYDVYAISYYSPLWGKAPTLFELATQLNFELEAKRILVNYDEVIFVAHSMGNLVVRQAMLDRNKYEHVRVPLIVSFAAPSNGSDLANLAAVVSANPQFRDMFRLDYNSYLQALNAEWKRARLNTEIACAYELRDYPRLGKRVVEMGSATAACTRDPAMPIVADHSDMVKPFGLTDPIHEWLRLELLRVPRLADPEYELVLIDSAALIYNPGRPGETNSHVIQRELQRNLHSLNINTVPIFDGWRDYDTIVKRKPEADLIIMHFSALYGESSPNDPEERLKRFVIRILDATKKTKLLIYSRWNEKHVLNDGNTLGQMKEFVINLLPGDYRTQYSSRIEVFDVNRFGLTSPAFDHPVIADELENGVKAMLSRR